MGIFHRCFRGIAAAGAAMLLAGCGEELSPPALLEPEVVPCELRLGCATASNLAAMVDRPADLVMPRRSRPRDAVRREAVLASYREGGLKAPVLPSPGGAAKP